MEERDLGVELKESLNAKFTITSVEHSCRTRVLDKHTAVRIYLQRQLLQYLRCTVQIVVFCQKLSSPNKLPKSRSSVQKDLTVGYLEQ